MATGTPFTIAERKPVAGGCINESWRFDGIDGRRFFVKKNSAGNETMFAAEAAGLQEIIDADTVIAPVPICFGTMENDAFLVLEYLNLGGINAAQCLGHELAEMHRCVQPRFGWSRDNTIGSTFQPNSMCDDWLCFWREQRFGHQLRLAEQNGYGGGLQEKGMELLQLFPVLFSGYCPEASLLHGDLWSGNHATMTDGRPVIFDPAVYFGDREADIAMTELFGGFPADFYASYNESWPLDEGYPVRRELYNLYHILNHLNLFGDVYLQQAERIMDFLLSELS